MMGLPKIWRPKILVVAWILAIVVVTGSALALASREPPAVTYAPADAPPAPPTLGPGDAAKAEQTLRAYPAFAQLPSASSAVVRNAFPASRDRAKVGTTLHVSMTKPVAAKGPWLFLACRGSKQIEQRLTLSEVTALRVSIDASGNVFEFAPMAPAVDQQGGTPDAVEAAAGPPTVIRDLATSKEIWKSGRGETLASAAPYLQCGPGQNDD